MLRSVLQSRETVEYSVLCVSYTSACDLQVLHFAQTKLVSIEATTRNRCRNHQAELLESITIELLEDRLLPHNYLHARWHQSHFHQVLLLLHLQHGEASSHPRIL